MNFYWLVLDVSITNHNYQKGNFVYSHCGCTSMYRPLSYLFKYLLIMDVLVLVYINFLYFLGELRQEKRTESIVSSMTR